MKGLKDQAFAENAVVVGNLLNLGTLIIRKSGVQAELGGPAASKFKDSDVLGLLAARVVNRKKL